MLFYSICAIYNPNNMLSYLYYRFVNISITVNIGYRLLGNVTPLTLKDHCHIDGDVLYVWCSQLDKETFQLIVNGRF